MKPNGFTGHQITTKKTCQILCFIFGTVEPSNTGFILLGKQLGASFKEFLQQNRQVIHSSIIFILWRKY